MSCKPQLAPMVSRTGKVRHLASLAVPVAGYWSLCGKRMDAQWTAEEWLLGAGHLTYPDCPACARLVKTA